MEILERLKTLETKIDRMPMMPHIMPPEFDPPAPSGPSGPSQQPSASQVPYHIGAIETQNIYSDPSLHPSQILSSRKQSPYKHSSASLKILTWPAMQQLLLQALPSAVADLKLLEQEGLVFLMRVHKETSIPSLPLDEHIQEQPFVGMQTQATRAAGGRRITFPALNRETMHQLATVYFDTFNFLYPFMDRQTFMQDTLSKVSVEGFNGDNDSVIALLVFALGELAIEGTRGKPIDEYKGRPSGIRGGTAAKPPGLALFNEARRRIGFTLTECDLENVQIYSLAGCVKLNLSFPLHIPLFSVYFWDVEAHVVMQFILGFLLSAPGKSCSLSSLHG